MNAEERDKVWAGGYRAAQVSQLRAALGMLGYPQNDDASKYILEREDAIAALREACEIAGDNDWDDRLYLRDIIEKHLTKYFEE